MEEIGDQIKGLVHCSGGGQTKCMRFGHQVHHIKDDLFETPPLFKEIQRVSGTKDAEMYQVYNMGHRFEVYCLPSAAEAAIQLAKSFNIDAKVIGYTEKSKKPDYRNHLDIKFKNHTLTYG